MSDGPTRWQGEPLDGKTIHVTAEQGLGDEVLFASMIGDLLDRGAHVIWDADERLLPLLRRSYPGVTFVRRKAAASMHADFHSPAGSLGCYLRRSAADFPRRPYLKANEEYAAVLRGAIPHKIPVGISWVSSNKVVGVNKTVPLDQWQPILRNRNIIPVDLQYGAHDHAGWAIHSAPGLDLTNDIDGLAALIWACEAVVSVSNTVAHLAGAQGVKVFVLAPSKLGRFWYWGAGEETPWYPTARVFRQTGTDWGPAVRAAAEKLGA